MYAIAVGKYGSSTNDLDEKELNNIAGDPSRVIVADTYADLHLILSDLVQKTCYGGEIVWNYSIFTFYPHILWIVAPTNFICASVCLCVCLSVCPAFTAHISLTIG